MSGKNDRQKGRLNAGNENTKNMQARRKTESDARTEHRLARLQRYYDAHLEPRRNKKESRNDRAHGASKEIRTDRNIHEEPKDPIEEPAGSLATIIR